jgi:carbonic anhydrase/acetyltransferase-like protein (isoleucine patch superfamily)
MSDHAPALSAAAAARPAIMCSGVSVEGDVEVGPGVIMHPQCHISAAPGASIRIGANTVIEERVLIRSTHGNVSIGDLCLLQVGCSIQDSVVGHGSEVEVNASVRNSQVFVLA